MCDYANCSIKFVSTHPQTSHIAGPSRLTSKRDIGSIFFAPFVNADEELCKIIPIFIGKMGKTIIPAGIIYSIDYTFAVFVWNVWIIVMKTESRDFNLNDIPDVIRIYHSA